MFSLHIRMYWVRLLIVSTLNLNSFPCFTKFSIIWVTSDLTNSSLTLHRFLAHANLFPQLPQMLAAIGLHICVLLERTVFGYREPLGEGGLGSYTPPQR